MKNEQKSLARKERKEQKQKLKEEKYFQKFGVHRNEIENKKEKFKIKYTPKMLSYLKGSGWSIFALFLLLGIMIAMNAVMPIAQSNIVDNAVAGDWQKVFIYIMLFCLFLFAGPVWYVFDILMNRLNAKIRDNMRMDMVDAVAKSKINYFNKVDSGSVLSRVNNDPGNFMSHIYNMLMQLRNVVIDLSRVVIIAVISWKIALFLFAGAVVLYVVNVVYNRIRMVPAETRDQKINDSFNSTSTEMIRGIRDIKNLNIFPHFFNRFKQVSSYKMESFKDVGKKGAISEDLLGWSGIQDVFEILAILFGLYLASIGDVTIGQFSVILFNSGAVLALSHRFSYMKAAIMRMEISAKRMYEIIDDEQNPKETFGNVVLENAKGDIEFRNVGFSYNNEQVFENLNLKIKAGQCVGFVGKSGEGKSTILSLIPRLYDVNSGSVLIDGIDVRDLTKDSLRETVSVVSQSPYIFNMSIKENLKLVKPDATDKEIKDACKRAAIWDFIKSKPEGLNTKVGEGGVVLSGGQKQRIAIARAFLKESKVLLLDEATSALDNESQAEVKKAIKNMKKTCTIVIVAHRLSTVQDCDKIFVLENHKIVGEGSHRNLIKSCKAYKNLYQQEE